jgi:hypothetical protein
VDIVIKPSKCVVGTHEVEYIGRVIDRHGISFSKEALSKALNFRKLATYEDMKGFIGLVTYFSPHIKDFTNMSRVLHSSIPAYSKKIRNKRLVWTPELQTAYDDMLNAVEDSSKLYFVDNDYPLYCETDASKYGIGAIIYQIIGGIFRPIAIMSKSLSGAQLRWSVPEKEAYAIYYTLKRYAYILRDTPFHLKTDHKNLIYINDVDLIKY